MPDIRGFNVNGSTSTNKDEVARSTAAAVTIAEEYDRQRGIGQYEGRDLATVFASEIAEHESIYAWLHSRVQNVDYSGLRIGDYFDVPVAAGTNVIAQTVRYVLAAVDPYYRCSDQPMPHHLAFVPEDGVLVGGSKAVGTNNIMWHTSNTNNGTASVPEPYLGSNLHNWEINDYLPALPLELRDVIINNRSLIEKRQGSGSLTEASGWAWGDLGKVWSLSEMEVYGCPLWGSKGYSVGMDCHFPLFDSTASRITPERVHWWLRSVGGGSASGVCSVNCVGHAHDNAPTNAGIRPRPCFLLG